MMKEEKSEQLKTTRMIVSIMVALTLMSIVIVSSCLAGWPINYVPPIEGRVIDATTGEPIENVIVSADWSKTIYAIIHPLSGTIDVKSVITDKEGRYRIPAKISLHLVSSFGWLRVYFCHPLYERQKVSWNGEDIKLLRKGKRICSSGFPIDGEYEKGAIHYDANLLTLEEKYVKPVREKGKEIGEQEIYKLSGDVHRHIELYEDGRYFLFVKKRGTS